ncbi:MAG: hypothetical protein J2P20_19185, partial [Pseudonocardia sp.]|nr:hypothetical protein [Pseudonocardia sp.]
LHARRSLSSTRIPVGIVGAGATIRLWHLPADVETYATVMGRPCSVACSPAKTSRFLERIARQT